MQITLHLFCALVQYTVYVGNSGPEFQRPIDTYVHKNVDANAAGHRYILAHSDEYSSESILVSVSLLQIQ